MINKEQNYDFIYKNGQKLDIEIKYYICYLIV